MIRKRIITLTMFILLGLLTVGLMVMVNQNVRYVPIQEIDSLIKDIERQEQENLRLQEQKTQHQAELEAYQKALSEDGDLEALLEQERDLYRTLAGLTTVAGEGVVVIVTDSDRALLENEDPNNLIVHDMDIRAIIEDLKYAGAEAIAVNGQRILFNITDIYCTGPTIKINDRVYAQPFIIEAIGDKTFLEAALTAPSTYGSILKQWGLFIEVNTSVYVEIPAYRGSADFQYMRKGE